MTNHHMTDYRLNQQNRTLNAWNKSVNENAILIACRNLRQSGSDQMSNYNNFSKMFHARCKILNIVRKTFFRYNWLTFIYFDLRLCQNMMSNQKEAVIFFTPLLVFAPSIGKFLQLFHILPTKTCSTSVKFMHKRLVSLCLFSMICTMNFISYIRCHIYLILQLFFQIAPNIIKFEF